MIWRQVQTSLKRVLNAKGAEGFARKQLGEKVGSSVESILGRDKLLDLNQV